MTVGISAANVASLWLNSIRGSGAVAATARTTIFAKLHTADPGAAGATAAAAGDTSRKACDQNASSSGSALALTANAGPWTNGGTSETITHISVWDASTAGNFLYSAALTASQAWASGNTFTLTALGVSLSPQAA